MDSCLSRARSDNEAQSHVILTVHNKCEFAWTAQMPDSRSWRKPFVGKQSFRTCSFDIYNGVEIIQVQVQFACCTVGFTMLCN
jgi:hypothetical protein